MWFEPMPHGMREISEDEILAAAEKIKASRSGVQEGGHGMGHPTLLPCQMPSHIHSIRACLQTSYRSQISEAARHTKAAKTSASLS